MGYFWDNNEEVEFKTLNGHLYLYVIHRNHSHNGFCPHAHILDLTNLSLDQAYVEREMNRYCGMAKDQGEVIEYR